jgi:hypothetical protein
MQRMFLAVAVVVFAAGHSASAQQPAQAPPQATGVIAGQLTTDGGAPLRKAQLRLYQAATRASRTATSDGEGRYVFANLPAGEYTLTADKPGYLSAVYGARRPGITSTGRPIVLGANQKLEKIDMVVPRGSVITGTILDEFGDPAFNTRVHALRVSYQNGAKSLSPVYTGTSDDRGAYRIPGLMPGEYLVAASPLDSVAMAAARAEAVRERQQQLAASGKGDNSVGPPPPPPPPSPIGYVPIYYPGTPSGASAGMVAVGPAQEVPGIDIKLQVIHAATISGRVTSVETPIPQTRVQLMDASMPVNTVGIWWTDMRPDGTFSFHGVVPGSYIVTGMGTPGGKPGMAGGEMWGRVDATADPRNASPVTLAMQRGISVSAAFATESLPPGFDPAKVRVSLSPISTPTDWEMPVYALPRDATGRHAVQNVLPGLFQFRVLGLPDGWAIESAMFDGRDVADLNLAIDGSRNITGVELKLTSRRAEVGGALTNASGAPVSDYHVILFPSERRFWVPQSRRIQVAQPGPDGRYSFRTLPPGDYRIAALADIEPGRQFDPDWLSQIFGAAIALQLSDGEKRNQDIRIR